MWGPVDAVADWLLHSLTARAQLRFGVLLTLGSVPFLVWGFWTNEPFLVYQMSALALLLTGVGIVIGAQVLEQTEEPVATAPSPCPNCGARQ